MIDRVETANSFIREGDFEKARKIYSGLLDQDPENVTNISGFFISSYWDNRLELILKTREGLERGRKLVHLFEEFDREIAKRAFPKNVSYQNATQCILGEASQHFRLSYQKEGTMGLDLVVLSELALCLVRTGDYKNAEDVLAYAASLQKTPDQVFLRAEALYFLGKEDLSRKLFTEGFLMDPSLLRLEIVHSEPLASAIKTLQKSIEAESDLKEFLPVYCLEKKLLPVLPRTEKEIFALFAETNRLYENLQKDSAYFFKLTCRILQFSLHILENTTEQSEIYQKTERILTATDPEFLSRYRLSGSG